MRTAGVVWPVNTFKHRKFRVSEKFVSISKSALNTLVLKYVQSIRLGWFVRRLFVRLVRNYVSTCGIFGHVGT